MALLSGAVHWNWVHGNTSGSSVASWQATMRMTTGSRTRRALRAEGLSSLRNGQRDQRFSIKIRKKKVRKTLNERP